MKKIRCEIYSRVVGYYRPVQNWNLGKKEEFKERMHFSTDKSLESSEKMNTEKAEAKAVAQIPH